MSASLRLHDLGPSPNSRKVRLALGYKGLAYERIPVNPADRTGLVALSGQPLAPVLEHGATILFDSASILRYLETNVQREPRLFSDDHDRMKAIERWEFWARTDLAPGIGMLFGQSFAATPDEDQVVRAAGLVNAAAAHLESKLGETALVGDTLTAADLTCAAWLGLGLMSPETASRHPILEFFRERLVIDPARRALRRWYESIDRYDR